MAYTRNSETQIYFECHGDGKETIVLVPGLGLNVDSWLPVTDILARKYTVVVLDPRGSGKSEVSDIHSYSGDSVAKDVKSVLDTLGIESCHIAGVSMGGMIAQDFMIRNSSRIKSAVLFSTFARPDAWFTRLFEVRRELIEKIGFVEHFKLFQMFIFSPFSYRDYPERVRAVQETVARNPPKEDGYLRQVDYCSNHDVLDELAGIALPVLVVSGANDTLTPPYLGEDISKALPNAKYIEVQGASHGLVFERPEAVALVIDNFVNNCGSDFNIDGNFFD